MEQDIQHIYFLGIGGIGMSALARYCAHEGYDVLGYDRTPSPLTEELIKEGMNILFDQNMAQGWNTHGLTPKDTLVVRTPAVPENQEVYTRLRQEGFRIIKRAELLGAITRRKKALCVAGTHGKTTTSTILAHIMHSSQQGGSAFLGGISNNYHSNLLLDKHSDFVVVEADEFDRSFHHLTPYMSVITSIEPDHLDIYGTPEGYQQGFDHYAELVEHTILLKAGFQLHGTPKATIYTYTGAIEQNHPNSADFYADHVRVQDGEISFDFHAPENAGLSFTTIRDVSLGVPVWVNIENSVAAMAIAALNGVDAEAIKQGVETYSGVYRRFNIHIKNTQIAYIDDYAHHPTELRESMESVRKVFPHREQWVIFQPHLFTRTRDFMSDFAQVLSHADRLILLPIYPARELPIEGITSDHLAQLAKQYNTSLQVEVIEKINLCHHLSRAISSSPRSKVLMTLGAGDIDRLVPEITKTINQL